MTKYGNIKTQIDGYDFDSKAEGDRYIELKAMLRARQISNLILQPSFSYYGKSKKPLFEYIADFKYEQDGKTIIEDVKSEITKKCAVFRLKKKLVEDQYGIEIQIVEM